MILFMAILLKIGEVCKVLMSLARYNERKYLDKTRRSQIGF